MAYMSATPSFVIRGLAGERKLRGTVRINGAKNAALKAMAAAILFDGPVTLKNVPDNDDIKTMSKILCDLGAFVSKEGAHTLVIDSSAIKSTDIDPKLAGTMRASVVLTGPMLGRFGKVSFPAPGGCVIGARPIDLFINGYEKMGAVTALDEKKCIYRIKAPESLNGTRVSFEKKSVGATETLMMAAVLGKGKTVLTNCALEPEIVNVAEWLNACGATIRGVGSPVIEIEGTNGNLLSSKGPCYTAIPDRIEAGSFLILGALCAKELTIEDCRPDHLGSVIDVLKASGVNIELTQSSIHIDNTNHINNAKLATTLKPFDIRTSEYPGFPTDLQAPLVVLLTQTKGESTVVETIFEGRFKYIEDLNKMGADIVLVGHQEIRIHGPTIFKELPDGGEVRAHDIRAGFAIVLAALIGKGEFTVNNIQLIDRGYEKLEERLQILGAVIERS